MSTTSLYELESISDHPLFHGFAYKNPKMPSLFGWKTRHNDLTPGYQIAKKNRNWQQPLLRPTWEPIPVVGQVGEYHDFPMLGGKPVFSDRAVAVLRDLLEPNGELLPLETETKNPYWFYNVTTIADVLDVDNSDCRFFSDPPTTAVNIRYFSFHRELIEGLRIFRIPEYPILTIVSNHFVDRVIEAGLAGFSITKLWPLEKGTYWRAPREVIETTDVDKAYLKQQTLILCFSLQAEEPTDRESELLKQIGAGFDEKLAIDKLDQAYFGSYDVVSIDDSEYRMFFSTPDVDVLVGYLSQMIKSIEWPGKIRVIKSNGHIHDTHAEQVVLSF